MKTQFKGRLQKSEHAYKKLEFKLKQIGENSIESKELRARMIKAYERFADLVTRACEQGML